jgi:hypothetical protein
MAQRSSSTDTRIRSGLAVGEGDGYRKIVSWLVGIDDACPVVTENVKTGRVSIQASRLRRKAS